MVKLENQVIVLYLKKSPDPKVWITDLDDLCVRLEDKSLRLFNSLSIC
jgi:hypothetical protein